MTAYTGGMYSIRRLRGEVVCFSDPGNRNALHTHLALLWSICVVSAERVSLARRCRASEFGTHRQCCITVSADMRTVCASLSEHSMREDNAATDRESTGSRDDPSYPMCVPVYAIGIPETTLVYGLSIVRGARC